MANEEHVALLRKGVNAWNKWRKENPEVLPNIRGANLMNTSLVDANLRGADLKEPILVVPTSGEQTSWEPTLFKSTSMELT